MSTSAILELIRSRRSTPKLTDPAPSGEELDQLLDCLLNAPDHGRIKPWQYWVVSGDGLAKLGDIFAEATKAANPDATPEQIEKSRGLPLRAPLMLVAATKAVEDHPKVPLVEQVASVSAAIQNAQLALAAMGYGCMWRTGTLAYNSAVKNAFDMVEADEIVGFLYIGTEAQPPKPPVQAAVADYVTFWS